jgi:hypothetical protein
MARIALRAETLGFESVWVAEHLVFPTQIQSRYPYSAEGVPPINPATPLLDPLLVLMQVAAVTERIRLGTNVYILPLRHPLVVARMAMTLDLLSNGRLTFGIGLGWLAEEFEAAGIDFATRGRERVSTRALRVLWSDAEPSFNGKYVSFGPVKFEPGAEAASADRLRRRERGGVGGGARRWLVRRRPHAGERTPAGRAAAPAARGSWARRSALRNDRQPRRRAQPRRRGALRRSRRASRRVAALAPRPRS